MKQKVLTKICILSCASALVLAGCSKGGAKVEGQEDSPGTKISMIVPFSAGGGSDLSGRAIAAGLEAVNGSTVTVSNVTGGSGAIGYSELLGAKGDATKLLASETAMMALPLVQTVQFTYKDYTPIMKLGDDYTLVVVPSDSPYKTCDEIVKAAESSKVVAAVSGATSLDEIVFSLIESETNVKFDRMPYESGGEVLAGILGKHVDVASLNPGEVIGQIQSGDLRALCALSDERYEYEELKDIPTGKEQGIDVAFAQFRGWISAGDIDPKHREYWIESGKKYAETDDYKKYIEENYMQSNISYGDDFSKYLDEYNAALKVGLKK